MNVSKNSLVNKLDSLIRLVTNLSNSVNEVNAWRNSLNENWPLRNETNRSHQATEFLLSQSSSNPTATSHNSVPTQTVPSVTQQPMLPNLTSYGNTTQRFG